MHPLSWWPILVALMPHGFSLAQTSTPTVCEEEACHCDSFTRVICNCTHGYDDVTLRPDGAFRVPPMTTGIVINGCKRVQFLPGTVKNLVFLRAVELTNVVNVVINERALAWDPFKRDTEDTPGIKITIHNCTVNEISSHAIQGRVANIVISNSRLSLIKPFAFSSLTGVNNIELLDNHYDNIEIQALKKFTTTNFIMRGGAVKTLPSRFLSDVEVTNLFIFDAVTVNYMYSLTFLVSSPTRVMIVNNVIRVLEGEAFKIATRGPITFRNNTIKIMRKGALQGLSVLSCVASVIGPQELLLENNTMTNLTQSALAFDKTSLTIRVDSLHLHRPCSCELEEEWQDLIKQSGTIYCWYDQEEHYASMPTFIDSRCWTTNHTLNISIIFGILFILTVATVIWLYVCHRKREKKKKVQIVRPDGKTYKETEFHIVVERAEILMTDL